MKRAARSVRYEENGVRVVMDRRFDPIQVVATTRMTVEEARALMASIERAISCYCHQLELGQ